MCWKLRAAIFSEKRNFKFPSFGNWRTWSQIEVILIYLGGGVLIAIVEANHADLITAHMVM